MLRDQTGSHDLLPELKQPDLLIRTGGERRLSNFMLWDLAYSELHFCDALWPNFDVEDFADALRDYCKRQRSYGRRPK